VRRLSLGAEQLETQEYQQQHASGTTADHHGQLLGVERVGG
jgi:hypothetical protein